MISCPVYSERTKILFIIREKYEFWKGNIFVKDFLTLLFLSQTRNLRESGKLRTALVSRKSSKGVPSSEKESAKMQHRIDEHPVFFCWKEIFCSNIAKDDYNWFLTFSQRDLHITFKIMSYVLSLHICTWNEGCLFFKFIYVLHFKFSLQFQRYITEFNIGSKNWNLKFSRGHFCTVLELNKIKRATSNTFRDMHLENLIIFSLYYWATDTLASSDSSLSVTPADILVASITFKPLPVAFWVNKPL